MFDIYATFAAERVYIFPVTVTALASGKRILVRTCDVTIMTYSSDSSYFEY